MATSADPAPSRRRRRLKIGLIALAIFGIAGFIFGPNLWAQWQISKGELALARSRPEEALAEFEAALRVRSQSAPLLRLAARSARLIENYEVAKAHLTRCQIAEGKASEETLLEWAMLNAETGELLAVENYLKKNSTHPTLGPYIFEALGRGYLNLYRHGDVAAAVERWLQLEPNNPRAKSLQGRLWQRVHNFPEAIDCFCRALELDSDRPLDRIRLAECLLEENRAEQAATELREVLKSRPDDSNSRLKLARALLASGQTEEAATQLGLIPENVETRSLRGRIALKSGDARNALALLEGVVAEEPYHRDSHFALLEVFRELADEPAARRQQERLKEVEDTINRYIELSIRQVPQRPDDVALLHELGTMLMKMKKPDAALGWFENVLLRQPNHRPTHQALMQHYESIGDDDRAARHRGFLK